MDIEKYIDILLQKGFTAVAGGLGLKLMIVDSLITGENKVAILAIGAFLLSVATVTSYLSWKVRVNIRYKG